MILIGLTGSIGMGKSTVASMFAELGASIWNADEAVHRLYAPGGAGVEPVGALFPDAVRDGAIDRNKLAALVLGSAEALGKLEAIVHPLVAADRMAFLDAAKKNGAVAAVLDVPLLFETGAQSAFDAVVVVSASASVQRERVLARPDMTEEKFEAILEKQTPDAQKREQANFVISTGQSLEVTRREVAEVYSKILKTHTL